MTHYPRQFTLLLAVVVACTALHATAVAIVFSSGNNVAGQAGLRTTIPNTAVATPINTSNLGGRSIKQVSAGAWYSLLLAEDGSVFSFGSNVVGRTGLGTTNGDTQVATPIDTTNLGGRAITQVAAGADHSLLLAEDGSVFSFGSNFAGATGLGTDFGNTLVATPIDTTNLGGRAITQVAAGFGHSLLLAEDGSVFSFGSNVAGKTGLGTASGKTVVATPIDTTNLGGLAIKQVSAAGDYSLLLAEDGSVFSFGVQVLNRPPRGTTSGYTLVATPIDTSNLGGRTITQVAAGVLHSLLLSEDGSVFSVGSNLSGRTGMGTVSGITLVATPIDTTNLGSLAFTQVAAGGNHSLLLAEDGHVYSFGSNFNGATALGTLNGDTLVATPIATAHLGGLKFKYVAAGLNHSLLIAVPESNSLTLAGFALIDLLGFARNRRYQRKNSLTKDKKTRR